MDQLINANLVVLFQMQPQQISEVHQCIYVHRAVNSFRGVILLVSRYALIRIILKLTQQIL